MPPVRLLELFFDDVLVDMIFCYTKLYSHRQKTGISSQITNEKIPLFLTMPLISGYHKLPDHKMYWDATIDTFVQARSGSMPSNTFQRNLENPHFCDNEQLDK